MRTLAAHEDPFDYHWATVSCSPPRLRPGQARDQAKPIVTALKSGVRRNVQVAEGLNGPVALLTATAWRSLLRA